MAVRNPTRPILYLVTDTNLCGGRDGLGSTVEAAVAGGVDFVQLRDHDATTRQLAEMAEELLTLCAPHGIPLIVDDRLDVALATGAAGVHLGQRDLPPEAARRLADACVGPEFHIGWSISNVEQARAVCALPSGVVDVLGIGPFRATPTKPDASAPLGSAGVSEVLSVVGSLEIPNVVIGGVKESDVSGLMNGGAGGVAVVSAICGQPDPGAATRAMRLALDATAANRGAAS